MENIRHKDLRYVNVYDAVNGELRRHVTYHHSVLEGTSEEEAGSRTMKNAGYALSPDEILSEQMHHKIQIPVESFEGAGPNEPHLPDSDLLQLIHYYITCKLEAMIPAHRRHMHNSMDETALIALGLLVEEWIRELQAGHSDSRTLLTPYYIRPCLVTKKTKRTVRKKNIKPPVADPELFKQYIEILDDSQSEEFNPIIVEPPRMPRRRIKKRGGRKKGTKSPKPSKRKPKNKPADLESSNTQIMEKNKREGSSKELKEQNGTVPDEQFQPIERPYTVVSVDQSKGEPENEASQLDKPDDNNEVLENIETLSEITEGVDVASNIQQKSKKKKHRKNKDKKRKKHDDGSEKTRKKHKHSNHETAMDNAEASNTQENPKKKKKKKSKDSIV